MGEAKRVFNEQILSWRMKVVRDKGPRRLTCHGALKFLPAPLFVRTAIQFFFFNCVPNLTVRAGCVVK